MEILLSKTTLVAILYFSAGLIQSFCYMNGRLPEDRRSPVYPKSPAAASLMNISWMVELVAAMAMTSTYGFTYLIGAIAIYFGILPFVFQIPMARMLGFKNLKAYFAIIDGVKKK